MKVSIDWKTAIWNKGAPGIFQLIMDTLLNDVDFAIA